MVKPGAYVLHRRYGTDDIANDNQNKTVNEIKQTNNKILTNNMLMDFLTIKDRLTYECLHFSLTCNCGFSKKSRNMNVHKQT